MYIPSSVHAALVQAKCLLAEPDDGVLRIYTASLDSPVPLSCSSYLINFVPKTHLNVSHPSLVGLPGGHLPLGPSIKIVHPLLVSFTVK